MKQPNTPSGDPQLFMYSGAKTPVVLGGGRDNEIHYWNNESTGVKSIFVNGKWVPVSTDAK